MLNRVSRASNDERSERREDLVVGQPLMARAEHIHRHADEIQHHRRHVEHVVGPVAPAGEESVEVAEDFLGPEIDAAFAGIAMRQFDHRDALRPEEKKKRDDPEPDGDAAVGGDRGHDVEIEDGDDEQQHEIAAPEGADQVRLFGLGRSWTICQRQLLSSSVSRSAARLVCQTGFSDARSSRRLATNVATCSVRDCHWLGALLLRFRQRGGDVVERGQVLVDVRLGVLDGDRPLLIPPIRAAPSRRGSPCRTSNDATDRCRSPPSRGSSGFPSDTA